MAIDLPKISQFFWKRSPSLIGVDIGSAGIVLVELSRTAHNEMRLERCVFEPLPPGAVVDGNIERIEDVSRVVLRAYERSGSKAKNVALGMPVSSVITKKIILPAGLTDAELALQVELEAGQYIPFALEEVSLDFALVGPVENSENEVEVLVAASRKEKVEDRVAVVEAAGLVPMVMDIESYAARAALIRLHAFSNDTLDGQTIALLHVGSRKMHLSIMQDTTVLYEYEQRFDGGPLMEAILEVYGLPVEDKSAKKKKTATSPESSAETLAPLLQDAATEIARTVQFFFTSTHIAQIDHLYLTGGCARAPALADIVGRRLDIVTTIANPFVGMKISDKISVDSLRLDASAYMVACGLAMRRFD